MKTTKQETKITSAEDVAARLEFLREETARLEKAWGLARGTRDMAPLVTAPPVEKPLAERIELALRQRPMSIDELGRELRESAGKVTAALKPMRKQLYNAGTEDDPAWFWIVGDSAATPEINAAVGALARFRPMRFHELVAATGARQGRVSGAIVAMQRDPEARLVNLDTAVRARWFIMPEGVELSKLKRR